jgi:predicted N-acyltransferase
MLRVEVIRELERIPAAEWNRVSGTAQPFLRHEFLVALERHDCVGSQYGWLPHHLIARDATGRLCGAVPLYLKDNSYGEFVFDWAWADAWHRAGIPYYPKLVSSIPYTPVTGPRLLVAADADREHVGTALVQAALALVESTGASSLHWLFTDSADTEWLVGKGFLRRTGCHFHWHNAGYRDFEDFLARLSSRKRKKIRRERRYVQEAGIEMRILHGTECSRADWRVMHAFYRSTFEKKSGLPTLSEEFFVEISRTMGEQVVLVFALHNARPVAGAILLRGDNALYGRHWGCLAEYHSLHFEACYYQGIEYAIAHGLQLFEPGAQGEHKISRGFLPTFTWSVHWIRHPQFRAAIERFLQQEHAAMVDYHDELTAGAPFRRTGAGETTGTPER